MTRTAPTTAPVLISQPMYIHFYVIDICTMYILYIYKFKHFIQQVGVIDFCCLPQVNVIDNKRLFVVQSRGELREGGERQVFLWKKDDNDDDDDNDIV